MSTSTFHDNLNNWANQEGFSHWGQASLHTPLSLEFYRSWLEQNYHGEMQYLASHLQTKENPKLLNARLESAIVFAHPYYPHPSPLMPPPSQSLRTALYAQGVDYHLWLKEKLESVAARLRELYPDEVFLCFTDSSPILERDLAYRAGLGWVGKNTCLIDPKKGSLFLIGEILSSIRFADSLETVPDFCGTCTRCIEICPTGALESPKLLNAQKCISYLTIESRQIPSLELRSQIGDMFFGCDLCQSICPWNQKVFSKKMEAKLETALHRDLSEESRQELVAELREILSLSGKRLQKKFSDSPLLRAGPFGLRRNAIVVATNQKLLELTAEIQNWEKDPKLNELVSWSLALLTNQDPAS